MLFPKRIEYLTKSPFLGMGTLPSNCWSEGVQETLQIRPDVAIVLTHFLKPESMMLSLKTPHTLDTEFGELKLELTQKPHPSGLSHSIQRCYES